jgi:K+-transporting ATPase ATPase C chain
MGNTVVDALRRHLVALRALLIATLITGIAYPLLILGIGQLAFAGHANGSLVSSGGKQVASSLIGQSYATAKGAAIAKWFQTRPAANLADPYDGAASGASNLGPDNSTLLAAVKARRAQVAKDNGIPAADVPPDALTASGSGLEPFISPAYAALQVNRVAKANGLSAAQVRALVAAHTQGRTLGFIGEPRVNVVTLNIALAKLAG